MEKNKKKKIDIDEALEQETIHTFEGADQKEKEHQELKSSNGKEEKKAGRNVMGKSKATNKIAFVIDDEQLEYLESLTDRKDRTPNAIAKKIFIANYELNKKG